MLSWDEVEKDETEEDFLAAKNEDGEAPVPAACPLNPDGLTTCDASSHDPAEWLGALPSPLLTRLQRETPHDAQPPATSHRPRHRSRR